METLDSFAINSNEERHYEIAEKGKRLGNYIIDRIITNVLLVGVYLLVYWNRLEAIPDDDDLSNKLIEYVYGAIFAVLYYTTTEYLLKGKSLGKFITGTRAVTTNDYGKLTFQDALVRSLCRIIPFEAFSFLGDQKNGWHDRLSNTEVIMDRGWKDKPTL